MSFFVRPATAQDSTAVVSVIRAVYEDYGFTWDEEGYHADLYDLNAHYFEHGDRFWVAESNEIVGTIALEFFPIIPSESSEIGEIVWHEGKRRIAGCDSAINRLYVHPNARRQGIAAGLMSELIRTARAENRQAIEIWSDKRFEAAHLLYGRFGAIQLGDRICDDPDESPEFGLKLTL